MADGTGVYLPERRKFFLDKVLEKELCHHSPVREATEIVSVDTHGGAPGGHQRFLPKSTPHAQNPHLKLLT